MANDAAGAADDDFADFQTPSPVPTIISILTSTSVPTGFPNSNLAAANPAPWPENSPWYAIWERHSPADFLVEFYILLILGFVIGCHVWGSRKNQEIAKQWMKNHLPVLEKEFAMVGLETGPNTLGSEDNQKIDEHKLVMENSSTEFVSYASGRTNIAFAHISIKLQRRANPIGLFGEHLVSFIMDSVPKPADTVTITLSPFDGAEKSAVPSSTLGQNSSGTSKYDNFIFAVVNKVNMDKWREERYDLSLTRTADWGKLPKWTTTMSEAKEIGEFLLTNDLKNAIDGLEQGGMEYIIVTDQKAGKPTKVEETNPKKRIILHLPLQNKANHSTLPLVQAFIRLADHLPTTRSNFTPILTRKIQTTRDAEIKKLSKAAEEEVAEEREQKKAEEKKKEREEKLRGMTSAEQKRFLEKEREKEIRKMQKKGSRRA